LIFSVERGIFHTRDRQILAQETAGFMIYLFQASFLIVYKKPPTIKRHAYTPDQTQGSGIAKDDSKYK
jgi:hypothetical protein